MTGIILPLISRDFPLPHLRNVVVHPGYPGKVAGKETRIISGHDLRGINPPTSTCAGLVRTGMPFNRAKLWRMSSTRMITNRTIGQPCYRFEHTE